MKLQRKIVTLATLGLALSAAAVPAKREVRTVTQPDGTTIEVRIVGDEYLHYMVTNDGNIVSRDTHSAFRHAMPLSNRSGLMLRLAQTATPAAE